MRAGRLGGRDLTALGLGLAFLYVPILLVVAFSFNRSRLVTVWGGFSTEWYASLLTNEPLKRAAVNSLAVAVASAALATILGTMAALALARPRRGAGQAALSGLLIVPAVLPDVILGLSLLLLFVGLGLERGLVTIVVAHTTLTLAFTTVIIQSRLASLDGSLVDAARDLGASPAVAFLTVTLPAIRPAVASAFCLAVSLSLDDLVLASFTAGPGATTLPMVIYSSVRLGVTPAVNAVSTLLVAAVGLTVLVAALAGRRRDPRSSS